MARSPRNLRRVEEVNENTGSQEEPVGKRRKRAVKDEYSAEEYHEPEPQPRNSIEGSSNLQGGGSSGGGRSSRSIGKRCSGFLDMRSSQDAGGEAEESYEFSESQGDARAKAALAAAQQSKEVLIEAKDNDKASELSPPERETLVKSMMRFLVMKGLTHEPASKKEMMDNVLGKTYRGKGVLKYVLGKADQRLRASVGFRVKCPPPHHAYYVKDTYYVINTLHSAEILKGPGQAARGLLTMVLCVINCSTDRLVNEDDLFKKLHHQIDNRIPEKPWSLSGRGNIRTKTKAYVQGVGDLHDLFAMFVKQHYLGKKSIKKPTPDGGEETIYAYTMGARAALEIGEMQILTLMAETMGSTVDPSALVELEDNGGSQNLSQMASQAD